MSSRIRCGMFSWPSGAKVSWSRAPPPKVITTTFLFLRVVAALAIALGPSSALPSASPAALRRNSRRLRASWRANSRGLQVAAAARSLAVRVEELYAIASPVLTTYMWARASRSCMPARARTLAPTLKSSLRGLPAFRRIDELPDVRPLLIDLRQMLGPESLIHLQLCLRKFRLLGVHISLAQPVVHVRQVRTQLTRPD